MIIEASPAYLNAHLFNGLRLFGWPTRQGGPIPAYRTQKHVIPGIRGFRIFDLGAESLTYTVRGRISTLSLAECEELVALGCSYVDANVYQFRTTSLLLLNNCNMTDFRPVGGFQRMKYRTLDAWTVEVQGTVVWMNP